MIDLRASILEMTDLVPEEIQKNFFDEKNGVQFKNDILYLPLFNYYSAILPKDKAIAYLMNQADVVAESCNRTLPGGLNEMRPYHASEQEQTLTMFDASYHDISSLALGFDFETPERYASNIFKEFSLGPAIQGLAVAHIKLEYAKSEAEKHFLERLHKKLGEKQ